MSTKENDDVPPLGDVPPVGDTAEETPKEKEKNAEDQEAAALPTPSNAPPSEEDTVKNEEKRSSSIKKGNKFTYRDYSHVEPTHPHHATALSPNSSAIRVQKLPAKLNAMLSHPEYQHIISWMPHGRSWKVHNPHAFVEDVIPKFFEYTNYNSFVRLVNAWGFRRITKGPDRNSYYHELFLRGMPHLHNKMHRLTANEKKLPVDPDDEPDFYKISAVCPLPLATDHPMARAAVSHHPSRNPLHLHKQMMSQQMSAAAGMGGLGMPGATSMMGAYPDLAAVRMATVNPMVAAAQMEEEEMALAAAGMAPAAFMPGQMNASLSQQRAELIATNQAYEIQLARLREQERRLVMLSGGAGATTALGGGLGYPSMGRMGMGLAPGMAGMGMLPETMMSDPTNMGQMPQGMMARLPGSQGQKSPSQRI